jgi:hypothetical protein
MRAFKWIAVALVVVAVGAWAILFGIQRHNVNVATNLLRATSAVHVGATTTADLLNLVPNLTRYNEDQAPSSLCIDADAFYAYGAGGPYFGWRPRLGFLRWVGLQEWGVGANFWVKQDKVCAFGFNLYVPRRRPSKDMMIDIEGHPSTKYTPVSYTVRGSGTKVYGYTLVLYPEATPQEHARAFDLDFSCAASFHGCGGGCDVILSGWPDLVANASQVSNPNYRLSTFSCQRR